MEEKLVTDQYILDMRLLVRNGVSCPVCKAPIGEPCYSPTGRPRRSHHSARNDVHWGRKPRLPLHPDAQ